jgi:uncharacterized membrane protein YeaQ/YmgE (transglycosylase-associated protein family)
LSLAFEGRSALSKLALIRHGDGGRRSQTPPRGGITEVKRIMGIVVWIIVGAIAGFVAGKVVTGRGLGLLWDIVVGIVGAFLGGWLASLAGIGVSTGTFTVGGLVAAIVGSIILLGAFKLLTGRGMQHA